MALLALVAAADRKGISRDRIVGILWPESEEDQARHTLSQTLYSLRRDTGRDPITGSPHLRLDPAVSSDVGDFRAATSAGETDRAGDLYAGRFLDGFYLPGVLLFVFCGIRSPGAATLPVLAVRGIRAQYPPDSTGLGPMVRDLLATSPGALELMPRGPDPAPGAGRAERLERVGERAERRGNQFERRGERLERNGHERAGEIAERRGECLERRGDRLERRGE